MSKENLEQFMSKVADSEELQAKVGEEIDAEALIALGAECSCEFTAEELQDSAELSEEELGTVAGGAGNSYLDRRLAATRRARRARSQHHNTGLCHKYYVGKIYSGSNLYVIKALASGADCDQVGSGWHYD